MKDWPQKGDSILDGCYGAIDELWGHEPGVLHEESEWVDGSE